MLRQLNNSFLDIGLMYRLYKETVVQHIDFETFPGK